MKPYFYSTLFIISSLSMHSCYAPEQNCAKFQQGTFEFEALVEGELKKTRFLRNESFEIEYYEGKTDTAQIRWINDCEYVLKSQDPKNRQEAQAMHFKILTTQNNQYTFEYSLVGSDNKQQGTAYKVVNDD